MKNKVLDFENLYDDLNSLDAWFLTGFPEHLDTEKYVKKRQELRKKYEKLKNKDEVYTR